ncbi:apple domain-containing protein [Nephila pilipes]|uniref:Apple domain-containing protein n=1 Tax=Nephila pilipes TaxID=299642 RepID=A0A8X6NY78_NEPPI|nr:apple domain-containing protein [Nephila pilipes]
MKIFVKAPNKECQGFRQCFQRRQKAVFPKLKEEMLKEGIFIRLRIRKVFKDPTFDAKLTNIELAARSSFKAIIHRFLVKNKDGLCSCSKLSIRQLRNMGLQNIFKIPFLHLQLDFFLNNLGVVSSKQGERFHQDILTMEHRYQERRDNAIVKSNYCLFLYRTSEVLYRKKTSISFFAISNWY